MGVGVKFIIGFIGLMLWVWITLYIMQRAVNLSMVNYMMVCSGWTFGCLSVVIYASEKCTPK